LLDDSRRPKHLCQCSRFIVVKVNRDCTFIGVVMAIHEQFASTGFVDENPYSGASRGREIESNSDTREMGFLNVSHLQRLGRMKFIGSVGLIGPNPNG
jgi:hypothetical protein